MTYGKLHAFVGPMFAGKTEGLVKEVLFRTYFTSDQDTESSQVAIYKPRVDTRYGTSQIVSHTGLTIDAKAISCAEDITRTGVGAVFFDEVQFFSAPHFAGDLLDAIREIRMNGIDVFVAGLDMDFMGRAFEVSSTLMAEASHLTRMTAECSVCGAPATHTTRLEMTAERILLGAHDLYAPMCASHWFAERCAGVEPEGL